MKNILLIGCGLLGSSLLRKINNKKIPLMVDLLKAILKNKKLNIRWQKN